MAQTTRARAAQDGESYAWAGGLLIAAALLPIGPQRASAQLLDRASEAVRGTDDQGYSSSSSSSRARDDDDDASSCPTPSYDDASSSSYSGVSGSSGSSSYSGTGSSGWSIQADEVHSLAPYEETWWDEDDRAWRSGLRLDTELGYAIGGAGRGAFGGRAYLGWVGLAARYSGFLDPSGEEVRGAMLGRIAFEVFVVNEASGELRLGAGFRHWQDHFGGEYGFDVGLSFDVYPVEPLIVSGELSVGMLGASVVLLARAEIGVMLDSTELFLGYHYEALATQSSYVDLGGPLLGVRVWL